VGAQWRRTVESVAGVEPLVKHPGVLLAALFAEDAKMAWPSENKYLHVHVHSQNDLLSSEL